MPGVRFDSERKERKSVMLGTPCVKVNTGFCGYDHEDGEVCIYVRVDCLSSYVLLCKTRIGFA